MLLLKRFRNPFLFVPSLHYKLACKYTITALGKQNNPLKNMPIQKILKLSQINKYNTAKDAVLCALYLEAFNNKMPANSNYNQSIKKQVRRVIQCSLQFLHELNLLEILLISNNVLALSSEKNLNISPELINRFLQDANRNIIKCIKTRQFNDKNLQLIVAYMKQIVLNKKPVYLAVQLVDYITKKQKTQHELIQVLNILISLRANNKYIIQELIKNMLEQEVAKKIYKAPLSSQLFDEIVLKVFINIKFHIKKPYHCIPFWLIYLNRRIKQKYMNPAFQISKTKKIQFFNVYIKFLLQSNLIIQTSQLKTSDFDFLGPYFKIICSELDYMDYQNFFSQINLMLESFDHYVKFIDKYSFYSTPQAWDLIEDSIIKIYETIKRKFQSQKNQVIAAIACLNKFMNFFLKLMKRSKQKIYLSDQTVQKIFNKSIKLVQNRLAAKETETNFQIFYTINSIIQTWKCCYNRNSESQKINKITSLIQSCVNSLQVSISSNNNNNNFQMLQISNVSHCITTCYSFYLSIKQKQIPFQLAQFQSQNQEINLIAVIQSVVESPFLKNYQVKKYFMALCQKLNTKIGAFLGNDKFGQKINERRQANKLNGNSQQKIIINSLIRTIKTFQIQNQHIITEPLKYWFIDNKKLILELWGNQKNERLYQQNWTILKQIIRYFSALTKKCGIDLLAQIIRVCQSTSNQQFKAICNKALLVFNSRTSYHVLLLKNDEMAAYKYLWLIYLISLNQDFLIFDQKDVEHQTNKNLRNMVSQKSKQRKFYDQKIMNKEESKFSFYKLIQLIALCCYDNKQPLQTPQVSFRTKHTCKIINACLNNIMRLVQPKDLQSEYDIQYVSKTKQNLLNIPIEQIIYYLTLHNGQGQASWLQDILPSNLLSFMDDSYLKISQYNTLLAFNLANDKMQKIHNSFLSQQQLGYKSKPELTNQNGSPSTVLKFYQHLLAPNPSPEAVKQSLQAIQSGIFTIQQIIGFWTSKNIAMRAKNQLLLQAMLSQLLKTGIAIRVKEFIGQALPFTYIQFTTSLNVIYSLLKNKRLEAYRTRKNKTEQLTKWVHNIFTIFSRNNLQQHIYDYFVIRQNSGPIQMIQNQLQSIIGESLQKDKIQIVQKLYYCQYKLDKDNIANLRWMLDRMENRCLLNNYFQLSFNSQFRVNMFLKTTLAVIYIQNDFDLLKWYMNQYLVRLDVKNIQQYLSDSSNFDQLHLTIMLYHLGATKLNKQLNTNIELYNILDNLYASHINEIHNKICKSQKTLYNILINENKEQQIGKYQFIEINGNANTNDANRSSPIILLQKQQFSIHSTENKQYIYLSNSRTKPEKDNSNSNNNSNNDNNINAATTVQQKIQLEYLQLFVSDSVISVNYL